ncbi:hypothetical protein GQ55_4G038500 [Panicum hallii var. hallii]|uniref:Uncharacterized protein n=1 Tax=Panicum hallii var. hallii TaxID=1504633 RepID=A0A2T7DUZ1_9POAL|nr:hypothetical protein GQ55_4G038500 [Panicum hallii var. hallii]
MLPNLSFFRRGVGLAFRGQRLNAHAAASCGCRRDDRCLFQFQFHHRHRRGTWLDDPPCSPVRRRLPRRCAPPQRFPSTRRRAFCCSRRTCGHGWTCA